MRVLVCVKATEATEAGEMPDEAMLTAMGNYNQELLKAGIMLAGEGLHPTSRAKRVRYTANGPTIIDGPFAETKELIAGFWMWQVRSMEEAAEWLKRCPMGQGAEVDIRPVFEASDFGAEFTPELQAQEARLRQETEKRQK